MKNITLDVNFESNWLLDIPFNSVLDFIGGEHQDNKSLLLNNIFLSNGRKSNKIPFKESKLSYGRFLDQM